jgi:hypothetical protein
MFRQALLGAAGEPGLHASERVRPRCRVPPDGAVFHLVEPRPHARRSVLAFRQLEPARERKRDRHVRLPEPDAVGDEAAALAPEPGGGLRFQAARDRVDAVAQAGQSSLR